MDELRTDVAANLPIQQVMRNYRAGVYGDICVEDLAVKLIGACDA